MYTFIFNPIATKNHDVIMYIKSSLISRYDKSKSKIKIQKSFIRGFIS